MAARNPKSFIFSIWPASPSPSPSPSATSKTQKFLIHRCFYYLITRRGFPPCGRLSRETWREEILQLPVQKSATEYSDYGALRLMLECERKTERKFFQSFSDDWNSQVVFWKELKDPRRSPATGMRGGLEICGQVSRPQRLCDR